MTEELTKMTFEDNSIKTMQYALDLVVIISYTFNVAVTSHSVLLTLPIISLDILGLAIESPIF